MNKDYYTILGISSGASQEEVQRAYENIVYDPSMNHSRETMIEIEEAYAVLSEPELRLQYDQIYKIQPNLLRNFDGLDVSRASQKFTMPQPDKMHKNFVGSDLNGLEESLAENIFETIQNIFSDVAKLSGDGGLAGYAASQAGEDIMVDLRLSPKEALAGGYKALEYNCYIECTECLKFKLNKDFELCPKCKGEKRIRVLRRVEVKIPSKVKTGTLLKIKEEGSCGRSGLLRGDLLVKVLVSKK
ncbi:MAG: J domain-containing protein [Candidatus Yanofskybacteria bacterium]|nr:J domain-containing protein [Candidatus Yanofskybacteria bacterium]